MRENYIDSFQTYHQIYRYPDSGFLHSLSDLFKFIDNTDD